MLKPNERLGNYEVVTAADGSAMVLGSGTGGITYRGRHVHLGTDVAIKVLVGRKNLVKKDRDAFLSEARAAASLTHPQIARILDFGESAQQHPYYVMELCEGGSLEEFRNKMGTPEISTCIQWLLESAAALSHAHQKGILHRDIKPSNLLISREQDAAVIKLIDFGLANSEGGSDQVIGTPYFAAPEQLRSHALPASDVFSLGATFLWLMTGQHLSEGSVKEVIGERLEAASYKRLLESLPAEWKNLLGRMLEVDPSCRFQNGSEVLSATQSEFSGHVSQSVSWIDASNASISVPKFSAPSVWHDLPDSKWSAVWSELAGTAVQAEFGTQLRATRDQGEVTYEVQRFYNLPEEVVKVLTEQAEELARHASELGLGEVILERGNNWHSVAWPELPDEDALSWVRRGQQASTVAVLSALDPIAMALDALKSCGCDQIELHPAMLAVSPASPLRFSLPLSLPVLEAHQEPEASAGTMRSSMGAGQSARFAACVYQLLSGRVPSPAAFLNAKAYQAIPKLTERSNRFLATAIAGAITDGTCRDVIQGLAHEKRIPGASLSIPLSNASHSASMTSARQSHPTGSIKGPLRPGVSPTDFASISVPLKVSPPIPTISPVEKPPLPTDGNSRAAKGKNFPIIVIAAAVILALLGGGAMLLLRNQPTPTENPQPIATAPVVTKLSETLADPEKTSPSTVPPTNEGVIRVPGDATTITEAVNRCQPGGTIELSPGTHAESIVITKSLTLVSKSAVVFEDPSSGSNLLTIRGPIQVTLRNIHIKNTNRQADTPVEQSPALVMVTDRATTHFDGCVIEGSSGMGISLMDQSSMTISNCRIRKNRDHGIIVASGSKVEMTLTEILENGRSGLVVINPESQATLGSGSIISANSRHGVELGNGAQFLARGAEIKLNQKAGLVIEGEGTVAKLQSSCVISENHLYGIGVRDFGRLELSDGSIEENGENGICVESGGKAEVVSTEFRATGNIAAYLVGGAASSMGLTKCIFDTHPDAGVVIIEGFGKVTDCRFLHNKPLALLFGKDSSGSATGNSFYPGPIESVFVIETTKDVSHEQNVIAPPP